MSESIVADLHNITTYCCEALKISCFAARNEEHMESLYADYPSDANGVMLDNTELMRRLEMLDSEIRKIRKKIITKKGKKKRTRGS